MINSINLRVDLSLAFVNKKIHLHEGDVNGTEIVLAVYDNNSEFDLTGCNAEYDATIDGRLAEAGAQATISETNKIKVPVTSNMTAINGLLLIDVKVKKNDDILTVYTVSASVKRAVVNGSTVIDISGTTLMRKIESAILAQESVYHDNIPESELPPSAMRLKDFDMLKRICQVNGATQFAPTIGYAFVFHTGVGNSTKTQFMLSTDGIKYRTKYSYMADYPDTWQVTATTKYVDNLIGDIGTALDTLNANLAEV